MNLKVYLLILVSLLSNILFANVISTSRLQQYDPLMEEAFEDVNSIFLFCQTKNGEEVVSKVDEFENKWFQKDKISYFNFIGLFVSRCNENANKYPKDSSMYHELSDKYTKMALDKLYNLSEDQKISISKEDQLTWQINQNIFSKLTKNIDDEKDWPEKRSEAAKYYFRVWERLENSIDSEDEIKIKIGNISYPKLSEYHIGGARGMSPNSIKDPEIRARYEKELNEYWEAVGYMNEQRRLQRLKVNGLLNLQRNIIRLYSGPEFLSKELEVEALKADISKYIKDEKIVSSIMEGLENRLAEDLKPRSQDFEMDMNMKIQDVPKRMQNEIVPPGFDKENSFGLIDNGQY